MPLKKSVRLPRRFNRPVSEQTKRFVSRRHDRRKEKRRERWRRMMRRTGRAFTDWRVWMQKWVIATVGCFALFFILLIVFSPIVQVREIRVKRTDLRIDAEAVQRSLAPIFGRHLLFLSTQEVSDLLHQSIPDAGHVSINKDYPSRITVTIMLEPLAAKLNIVSPDAPTAAAKSDEATGSGSAAAAPQGGDFLTVNGRYVVHPSPRTVGDLPSLTIVDWGVRPTAEQVLMSPEFLQAIFGAEETLKQEFNWDTKERIVFIRAREFHLKTKKYTLWFDLRSPQADQFARLKLFLKSVPDGEAKEYVDLRLSDRVVYR